MSVINIKLLQEHGVHYGHLAHKRHPKAEPYLLGKRGNIHIINLNKTLIKLQEAYNFVYKLSSEGKKILYICSKPYAKEIIKNEAIRSDNFFVNSRWLGGTLTNNPTIRQSINKLKKIEISAGVDKDYKGLLKKEASKLEKSRKKLDDLLGGIRNMFKLPAAVFVIDIHKEKIALNEAIKLKIPCIAITDSNVNPELVEYPIPGNDDSTKAIELFCQIISEASLSGRAIFDKFKLEQKEKEVKEKNDRESARAAAKSEADKKRAEKSEGKKEIKAKTEKKEAKAVSEVKTEKKEVKAVSEAKTEKKEVKAVSEAKTEKKEVKAVSEAKTEKKEVKAVSEAKTEKKEVKAVSEVKTEKKIKDLTKNIITITANLVKELRQITSAPLMDCKKALEESRGDLDQAKQLLRKKGQMLAEKRSSKHTNEGVIAIHVDNEKRQAGMVKLACETDFVAKNSKFITTAQELAKLASSGVESFDKKEINSVSTRDYITSLVTEIRESIVITQVEQMRWGVNSIFNYYIHHNKKVGVLLEISYDKPLSKEDRLEKTTKHICMHIAANRVDYIDESAIDSKIVEKEKLFLEDQLRESNKPKEVIEKILQGKLQKFKKEICLLEQAFFMIPELSIKVLLEQKGDTLGTKLKVNKFIKFVF